MGFIIIWFAFIALIPANFFEVKCVRIFVSTVPQFPKIYRRLPKIAKDFRRLSKITEDLPMTSDDCQSFLDNL